MSMKCPESPQRHGVHREEILLCALRASVVNTILLMGLAACGDRTEATPPQAKPQPSRTLQVVVSGDTRGFIVPCGCTSKQYGGLPRRATYLAGLPAGETLYVD